MLQTLVREFFLSGAVVFLALKSRVHFLHLREAYLLGNVALVLLLRALLKLVNFLLEVLECQRDLKNLTLLILVLLLQPGHVFSVPIISRFRLRLRLGD